MFVNLSSSIFSSANKNSVSCFIVLLDLSFHTCKMGVILFTLKSCYEVMCKVLIRQPGTWKILFPSLNLRLSGPRAKANANCHHEDKRINVRFGSGVWWE